MVLCCAQAPGAHAEEEAGRTGRPSRPVFVQLGYTPSEIFRADFRDEPGRVTVQHHDVSGTVMFLLPNRGRFNVTLSRDRHVYRFRNNPLLEGSLEDVRETRAGVAYMGPLSGDWSAFAMGGVRWAVEQGASRSDAMLANGMVSVQRPWLENVRLGVGVLASGRLERSPFVVPTVSIEWDITERWTLRTLRGLHLLYQLDEAGHWVASLNSEYHSRDIRMREDGIAPDGVFRSRLIVSTLALMYRPNPGVRIGAELGVVPWRRITIRDGDDETVFRSKVDVGPSAAFTANMTF